MNTDHISYPATTRMVRDIYSDLDGMSLSAAIELLQTIQKENEKDWETLSLSVEADEAYGSVYCEIAVMGTRPMNEEERAAYRDEMVSRVERTKAREMAEMQRLIRKYGSQS